MGFFAKLFAKPPEPDPTFTDHVLGTMAWSNDDEAWAGTYNGFKYFIDYEEQAVPSESVLAYAREILNDPAWLGKTLSEAKSKHKNELPEKLRTFYNDEIDALTWDTISFWGPRKKGQRRRIFGTLSGGRDYRDWRIEYEERTCQSLGFDN